MNKYDEKIYVELNSALNGGVIKYGGKNLKFTINSWLKNPEFDVNIFINPQLSKEVVASIVKDNKALYFTLSDMEVVTSVLQSKIEIRMINEMAKTILIKVKDVNFIKSTDIVNGVS